LTVSHKLAILKPIQRLILMGRQRRDVGNDVGDLLRGFRRDASLTQEALAERAGYSTVYVSMLERGQRTPQPATLEHLASALGLSSHQRNALLRAAGHAPTTRDEPIGRQREMVVLERHLAGDAPAVLALAGEPGIGKSHLLRVAKQRADAQGYRVLAAGCTRRGGQEPYAPLADAAAAALAARKGRDDTATPADYLPLHALLPELSSDISSAPVIPTVQQRRVLTTAFQGLLAETAGPSGTLLILDDLQWAGADALDLLAGLLTARGEIALRVLLAYRSTEVRPRAVLSVLLADLAREGRLTHHALGPLDSASASALLDRLVDSCPPDERERILRWSGGIPFFLISLGQAARSGDLPRRGIPWDLAQTIRERIAELSPLAGETLAVAAVAGRRAPADVVTSALIGHTTEVPALLEELCRARLLVEADGDYCFSHDVVREVVEGDLSAVRRTTLHRRVADALEGRPGGAPPAILAYHYARSDDGEKALHYLLRAGETAAQQHAYSAAEGYFREVIDRLESLGRYAEAAGARERLGQVLSTVGRYDEALTTLESAVMRYGTLGNREGVGRAVAAIGRVHYLRGTAEEGIDRLLPLRDTLSGSDAPRALAALNAALAPLFLAQRRYSEQLAAASWAADLAREYGDTRVLVEAEVWRGCALGQLGRRDEGRSVQEGAIALSEASGDVASLIHALNDVGFAYEQDGLFARSRAFKARALALAESGGDPATIANMLFRWGQNAFLRGDTATARASFLRARDILATVGSSSLSPYPDFGLALLALAAGDLNAVRVHGEASLASARDRNDVQAGRAAAALLAEADMQEGRAGDVVGRLRPLAGDAVGLGLHPLESVLAEAYWRLGEQQESLHWAEWSVRQAEDQHNRIALVEGLRVLALATCEPSRRERLAEEAVTLARSMEYAFGEARARETLRIVARLAPAPR